MTELVKRPDENKEKAQNVQEFSEDIFLDLGIVQDFLDKINKKIEDNIFTEKNQDGFLLR